MTGFTEDQVKRYMRAILPDGRELLAKRHGKSEIIVCTMEHKESWSHDPAQNMTAASVEALFAAFPDLAQMQWEPLFDEPHFG